MIWNDPKYALVIEALGPMEWPRADVENYLYILAPGLRGGWMVSGGRPQIGVWPEMVREVADFEAGCILAEFAEKWLAERETHVAHWGNGTYIVETCGGDGFEMALGGDGRFVKELPTSMYAVFTDRHETLAEGMLAKLREDGKL